MKPANTSSPIANLALPVFAAPMFLVSGTQLVIAACRAGIIGAFPAANARSSDIYEQWLHEITSALETSDAAPWAVNLVVHKLNPRLDKDLELTCKYQAPIVITALGSPKAVIEAIQGYGGKVFADVSTVAHARKAAAAGVDGLILVAAGSGGHTGSVSAFAFVPAVREFWHGPLVLAGGITDGKGVKAAQALGADYAYMGTRFIPAQESMANSSYKQMLIDSDVGDIICTNAFTGIPNNMLRPSIINAGLDPDNIPASERSSINFDDPHAGAKAWRDIWSAGHGVGSIQAVQSTQQIVESLTRQYLA